MAFSRQRESTLTGSRNKTVLYYSSKGKKKKKEREREKGKKKE